MKVTILDKDWELGPITPKQEEYLFVKTLAAYPDVDPETKQPVREQTKDEKEADMFIAFEALEMSKVDAKELDVTERQILGKAILLAYVGQDEKKVSKPESQVG